MSKFKSFVYGNAFIVDADAASIMAGTNDVGVNACDNQGMADALYATAITKLGSLYDYYATTLGKKVSALTIPPRSNGGHLPRRKLRSGNN